MEVKFAPGIDYNSENMNIQIRFSKCPNLLQVVLLPELNLNSRFIVTIRRSLEISLVIISPYSWLSKVYLKLSPWKCKICEQSKLCPDPPRFWEKNPRIFSSSYFHNFTYNFNCTILNIATNTMDTHLLIHNSTELWFFLYMS